MIFGGTALFLNVLANLALSLPVTVVAASLVIKFKPRFLYQYSADVRRRILWFLAGFPWIVGGLAVTLAIVPAGTGVILPTLEFLRWDHPYTFFTQSWHGLAAVVFLLAVNMWLLYHTVGLVKNIWHLKILHRFAKGYRDLFFELEADEPIAFTAGLVHPRCYITTALKHRIDEAEYAIIRLHEKAHAERNDPFKKWLFQVLTGFFPAGAARDLKQTMNITMEQCADVEVSRVIRDRTLIAKTLLKIKRLASKPFPAPADNRMVCHLVVDGLAERIDYLLSNEKYKAFPMVSLLIATVSMAVLSAFCAEAFHQAIEFLFTH